MNELERLQSAANKTELAASRRLSRRSGIPFQQALIAILRESAGDAGLDRLLDARAALRAEEAARKLARQAAREQDALRRRLRHADGATAWQAWFDGSARPNPGRCTIGALLRGPAGELVEVSQAAGYGNSSEAEYMALIAVLETALAHGAGELTVYGDSQVVIGDVNGPPHAAAAALLDYRARAHGLLAQLPAVTLRWIPRHRNREADALSQRGSSIDHDQHMPAES